MRGGGSGSAGAEKVFREKISGAVADRKALAKAIAALGPGDAPTRDAARSVSAINARFAQHSGRDRQSWRGLPLAGGSLGRYHDAARPLMLTVLGGLAEFERHLILSRTNEGRVRAKGARCSVWKKAEAHQASANRSIGEDGPGRDADRDCAKLQRQSHDD